MTFLNFYRFVSAVVGLMIGFTAFAAYAQSSASVVMYHRFGEDDYPSTSIKLDQFEAHLQELQTGRYNIMSLVDITAAIQAGQHLPNRTVGISIDDAYLSVYTEAWPRFKAARIPFTLFVATDAVDRATNGTFKRYMTWDQIREIAQDPLVTIGSQTASHLHMVNASDANTQADIERSNRRFMEELGKVPELLAYPYGEATAHEAELVKSLGFKAAFGQHSGAFGPNDPLYLLPRFALNETYGDLDRFRMVAGAKAMPATDMLPEDNLVSDAANPPALGFTVPADMTGRQALACFSNREGKLAIQWLGDMRAEVRMTEPLPQGRTRINCTAPAGDGQWYWLGRLFFKP